MSFLNQERYMWRSKKILFTLMAIYVILGPYIDSLNYAFIYAIIPCCFMYCIVQSSFFFKSGTYLRGFLLLLIWSVFCLLVNGCFSSYNLKAIRALLLTFFYCYVIVIICSREEKLIKYYYLIVLVWYISMWIYAISNFGLFHVDIQTDRFYGGDSLDAHHINSNRWGYFTLFLTYAAFLFSVISQKKKTRDFFMYLSLLSIGLVLFNAFITSSRQVVLLNIPLYIVFLLIRFRKSIHSVKAIFFTVLFLLCLGLFLGKSIVPFYNKSFLRERNKEKIEGGSRETLITKGINYGEDNMAFGIGPGSFVAKEEMITHSSFVQLFAETGIVGLCIYLAIIIGAIRSQFKRYKMTRNDTYLYFGTFLIFYFLDNFFYVFYDWPLLMSLFFIVVIHSNYLFYHNNYKSYNIFS